MPVEASTHQRPRGQSRWGVPILAVAIGVAYLVGGVLGGDTAFGVVGLALMTGLAAVLVLVRGRSETVRGLLDHRDERINSMDLRATAFAGNVVIVVVIAAFVVDIARGGDGSPYAFLGFVAGIAYTAAIVYHRLRG